MKRYEKPVKPHIYFRTGYWRVTHMPKPWHIRTNMQQAQWNSAHAQVIKLNGSDDYGLLMERAVSAFVGDPIVK